MEELKWEFNIEKNWDGTLLKIPIPMVVWQKNNTRLVLKRVPFSNNGIMSTYAEKEFIFEKLETKDALGNEIWVKIEVPNEFKSVILDFESQFDIPKVEEIKDTKL
jgi:hypothetical protein